MSTCSVAIRLRFFLVFAVLAAGVNGADAQAATAAQQTREPVLSAGEDSQALAKFREKLASPVTLEFVESPFSDIVEFLKDFSGVNIVLHKPALDKEGVTVDTPISIHVQSIRLASALSLMLRPYNLTWILENDCLLITSQLAANNHTVTRSYPVGDLAATPEAGAMLVALAKEILRADGKDLPGDRILSLDSLQAIVMTHNISAHDRLVRLFEQLRGGAEPPESVKKIHTMLNNPVTLEFVETPLSDIVDFLKDFTGFNIVLDKPALEEEGVNADTPCSIHVQSIALGSAIRILLDQYNLSVRIEDECLVITSKLSNRFELRTYSVSKLMGERAKPSREEWLRLASSVIGSDFVSPKPAESRRVFAPGSSVRVQWAGSYFPATVLALTESTYQVRFRVGETEREETVGSQFITEPFDRAPTSQPVIDFYEPHQSLVVLGPDSLHRKVEHLIGLVVKTAERSAK